MRLWPTVGTRSLLWGTHQFLLHPLMVALGWRRCYGSFPRDRRIWLAFFLHDLGYWGKPNMDGPEGQMHPLWAAELMHRRYDDPLAHDDHWWGFAAGHSRYFAERYGFRVSALMRADKMATVLVPLPLYLLLVCLSGEVREYVAHSHRVSGTPETVLGWALAQRADWRRRYGHLEVNG